MPQKSKDRSFLRSTLRQSSANQDADDSDTVGVQNGGSMFYVNKVGFPMDEHTWDRMWNFASKLHPDGIQIERGIRAEKCLPEIPIPHPPLNFGSGIPVPTRLEIVQKYLKQLQYNHTGTQFFDIKKNRPICGLMDCAKDMIKESLPIKCLEAVVLAIYLTNYYPSLDRFSISFKSISKGNAHRHVVLGLHYNGKYGAIGMSRRDDLMYKSLSFESLSQLILDFHNSYKKYSHVLDKVKIGLSIPHDPHTYESIQWSCLTLNVKKMKSEEICKEVDKFSREIRKHTNRWQSAAVDFTPNQKPRNSSPKRRIQSVPPDEIGKSNKIDVRLLRDRRLLANDIKEHEVSKSRILGERLPSHDLISIDQSIESLCMN